VNCVASGGGAVEDYRRIYFEGTRNLLAWLAPLPPRRFVYTSSTGVYGQTAGELVDETSPAEPDSATARVLRDTEDLLLQAKHTTGFPALILRLAGIYGPGRGYWLRQFLAGEARIEGDGSRVLNMIHRDDAVGAIRAALACGEPGRIYNVADDVPATQRELLTWLAETLKRPLPPSALADAGLFRKRGLTSKRVSNRRLHEELRFRPAHPSFREGFAAEMAAAR
jgi:nucleoside-diphosphate-sugar epimerase